MLNIVINYSAKVPADTRIYGLPVLYQEEQALKVMFNSWEG